MTMRTASEILIVEEAPTVVSETQPVQLALFPSLDLVSQEPLVARNVLPDQGQEKPSLEPDRCQYFQLPLFAVESLNR